MPLIFASIVAMKTVECLKRQQQSQKTVKNAQVLVDLNTIFHQIDSVLSKT